MGVIRGQKEYAKFQKGEKLTRKAAILANCYMCNGLEDSAEDCQGRTCPLYQYRPYKLKLRVEKTTFITPQLNRKEGVA